MDKAQLTRLAIAENFAENHMKRTGTAVRARPVMRGEFMHIVYDVANVDGYVFTLGAVEAFDYTQEELDGYAKRQKAMFPKGAFYGKPK